MEHDINKLRFQAHTLLQELINQAHFDRFLEGEVPFSMWYYDPMQGGAIPAHIKITHGSARMVFWDNDNPAYVFKMNINPNDIDYCASELFIYERACEEGISDCFAWTARVIDNAKFSVYAMTFCTVDDSAMSSACYNKQFEICCQERGYDSSSLTSEQVEYIRDYMGDYSDSDGMLEYARDYYDSDVYNQLCSFIRYYNIDDIHCGNWGYYHDQLVLTDYAGYEVDLIKLAKQHNE